MCTTFVMLFVILASYITTKKSNRKNIFEANIEALTNIESGQIVTCFMDFDTSAWFVDDEYHTVCIHPETGIQCRQIKGHDFSNPAQCFL